MTREWALSTGGPRRSSICQPPPWSARISESCPPRWATCCTTRSPRAARAPRSEIQLALRRLWLEVSTYAVRDEDAQPLGAVLVFEDLTAQKELAAQRREAEQFQLLTRVVARIADEIKNPLVSINTFIELIGERYDDPDFRRHFSAVVRRDVRRLVEVFEKLAGLVTEGELNFAIVDAREVVGQLIDAIDLADEAAGKQLQLEVVPESTAQLIKVDVGQLRKALSYLIRYLTHNSPTDLAKVSVSVGQHEDEEGGTDVRIMVGSRTASVSAREAAAAVRPRADGPGEPDRRGPRRQPATHRGAGRPAADAPDTARARLPRDAAHPVVTTAAPPLDAARILVVDDELGPRESLRMLLKPSYQIQTADSGRAALDQIPAYRPDIVILDIKMPELDGLEVLRRIKRIDPAIEVVMITAYASLETVKMALTHGAFEYLIKPFSRQDLEDVVRRALGRRHAELGTRGQLARLVEEMRRPGRQDPRARGGQAPRRGRAVAAGHPAVHPARDRPHLRQPARVRGASRPPSSASCRTGSATRSWPSPPRRR